MENDDIKTGNIDESGAIAIGRGATAIKQEGIQSQILGCVLEIKEKVGHLEGASEEFRTDISQVRTDIFQISKSIKGNGEVGLVRRVETLERVVPWNRIIFAVLLFIDVGAIVLILWHINATLAMMK